MIILYVQVCAECFIVLRSYCCLGKVVDYVVKQMPKPVTGGIHVSTGSFDLLGSTIWATTIALDGL